jgi:tricorn protease
MKRIVAVVIFISSTWGVSAAEEPKPLLLQKPTVNRTHIVFVYGDDLWIVDRNGGDARRLTSGSGTKTDPVFSPDGSQIAFTGEDQGNQDVYVIPANGGLARRLTYHPGPDRVIGWTPDGKQVLFRASRSSSSWYSRLFTVPREGGLPTEIPLVMAYDGSYSPDGTRLAYVPIPPAFQIWKRYRGGRATPVWIADLSDSHIQKVPRVDSNDFNPMWVGDRIYFLSDRDGPFTLYVYDPASKQVNRIFDNQGLDIKSASAGPDAIVYEQFGSIHLYDLRSGVRRDVGIRIPADIAEIRPHFEPVAKKIQNADISPSGVRAVFEARGEILTVPAEKGDIRNLTNSPGVADRDPVWSPDGKSIAYFSDESGEYELHVRPAHGFEALRKYQLGKAPSYYFGPIWSPDGKKIAYTDKRLNVWYLDLDTGKNTLVDTDRYDDRTLDPAWSPDSRWLAYTKQQKSGLRAVFLHSLETGKSHQVTDGMSDARFPVFDQGGKYLYFTASTDVGPALGSEMSNINRPVTRSVYVMTLRADLPSPLAPESDEEKDVPDKADEHAADKKGGADGPPLPKKPETAKAEASSPIAQGSSGDKTKADRMAIDLEDIEQRILALPIPARNYVAVLPAKAGAIFVLEGQPAGLDIGEGGRPKGTLHRFDLEKRKVEKFVEDASDVHVSHNGEKLLYKQGDGWFIVASGSPPKPGEGALKLDSMEVRVDPRAEWRQMYHEVWRIERDFLYDPGFHGLDLKAAEKKYEPYLDQLATRRDLNYLFSEMLGELTLGHVYVMGPDSERSRQVHNGLLGADYAIENNRYRFARVYQGENWNPELRAPLTAPGARVKVGEYLLAVNGRELRPTESVYAAFEGTAGKSIVLKVGPNPDAKGSREVTVVPIESEASLRNLTWIEENRRKVEQMTNGRVAYIYVPDTAMAGFTSFTRYFFAQAGKEGAIVDGRFNRGGIVPDYVIDSLRRPLMGYISTREGEDVTLPHGTILGPKVMVINEFAGSGGDDMPHYFRQAKVGPLIGKRTWGGLVGIGEYPQLIGGGTVTAPNAAFWFPPGEWQVENHGVDPDIEVDLDPQAVRAGHDPQLEKAVAVVMEALEKHPLAKYKKPAYPNYHKAKDTGTAAGQGGGGGRP